MKKLLMALCALFIAIPAFSAESLLGITGVDAPEIRSVAPATIQTTVRWPREGCSTCPGTTGTMNIRGKVLTALRPWECSDYPWTRNQIRYLLTGKYLNLDGPAGLSYVTWIQPWELAKTSFPFYRDWELSGSGCMEKGTRISSPCWFWSETRFNPKDLNVDWYTTDGGAWGLNLFQASQRGFGQFTDFFVGFDWGPDGLPNTSDDIEYTSGPARPVNELYYTGVWGGTDLSFSQLQARFANECFFVVFHYWLKDSSGTRFDQTVQVPVGNFFSGWLEIGKSTSSDEILVGVDPGGLRTRGFLFQKERVDSEWKLTSPEPYDSGWYLFDNKGDQTFYGLGASIYPDELP